MYLGSELTLYESRDNYLVDALKLALSISPYSIPCDMTFGLEVKRDQDVADIVRFQVIQILKYIDPSRNLVCTGCYLDGDMINIEVREESTGETLLYSLI